MLNTELSGNVCRTHHLQCSSCTQPGNLHPHPIVLGWSSGHRWAPWESSSIRHKKYLISAPKHTHSDLKVLNLWVPNENIFLVFSVSRIGENEKIMIIMFWNKKHQYWNLFNVFSWKFSSMIKNKVAKDTHTLSTPFLNAFLFIFKFYCMSW